VFDLLNNRCVVHSRFKIADFHALLLYQ